VKSHLTPDPKHETQDEDEEEDEEEEGVRNET
jgi:hypothetical protein